MSVGNIVSGFLGGIPCTGTLVRTIVNYQAGATHKTSQLINALAVAIITLIFMPAYVYMPMSTIAAILIVSASKLIPFEIMTELMIMDPAELVVLLITAFFAVFVDGAVGLCVGGIISILRTSAKS